MHARRRHSDDDGVVAGEHEVDDDDLRKGDKLLIQVHAILDRSSKRKRPPRRSGREAGGWLARAALGAAIRAGDQTHHLVGFDHGRDADADQGQDAGRIPIGKMLGR